MLLAVSAKRSTASSACSGPSSASAAAIGMTLRSESWSLRTTTSTGFDMGVSPKTNMLPGAPGGASGRGRPSSAARLQREADVKATDALRSVPGLDLAVSKVIQYGFERLYYLQNVASNVRV